jgi:hypothetical protein
MFKKPMECVIYKALTSPTWANVYLDCLDVVYTNVEQNVIEVYICPVF